MAGTVLIILAEEALICCLVTHKDMENTVAEQKISLSYKKVVGRPFKCVIS
jgi:hypothetical protein